MGRDTESIGIYLFFIAATVVMAAFTLGYVAHYDFGLSRKEIRTLALISAAVIGVLLATAYFGRRQPERK